MCICEFAEAYEEYFVHTRETDGGDRFAFLRRPVLFTTA